MNFSTGSKYLGGMESTAMSDIIFNLLIFFLLSSSFIIQSGIHVDLPKVVQASPLKLKDVVVTLKPDGSLFVNDRSVAWEEMRAALSSALDRAAERKVIIRGDEEAPFGRVVAIMEAAQGLGAIGIGVATRAKKPEESP
jgi:biopolymer transport protein ExbD